jgi:hypothetical protein
MFLLLKKLKIWSNTAKARGMGSKQLDADQLLTGTVSTESRLSPDNGLFYAISGGDGGWNGSGQNPATFVFDNSRVIRTSTETRGQNVAYPPRIHV